LIDKRVRESDIPDFITMEVERLLGGYSSINTMGMEDIAWLS